MQAKFITKVIIKDNNSDKQWSEML